MRQYAGISLVVAGVLAFLSLAAAPQQGLAAGEEDRDVAEVRDYRLTMAKVEKYAAVNEALVSVAERIPRVMEEEEGAANEKTLDEHVEEIEKHPAAVSVLRQHGFTPREYVVMTLTLASVAMAVEFKKQGYTQEIPDTVLPENAAFYEQNYEKIQALWKRLEATSKPKAGQDEEDPEEYDDKP